MQHQITGEKARPAIGGHVVVSGASFQRCAGLLCSEDIAADILFADGDEISSVPLQKGYNPVQATKVTFSTGAIIALYN